METLRRIRPVMLLVMVVLLGCASSTGNFCASYDPNVLYDPQSAQLTEQMILRSAPKASPQWLPDGSHIVYTSWPSGIPRPGYKSIIYATLPDGSNRRQLSVKRTNLDYEFDHSPDVSPDGSRIVYSTTRHKIEGLGSNPSHPRPKRNFEIEIVGLDGKERHRVTDHPAQDTWPAWSPDGKRIAFARMWPGGDEEDWGIFVANADGSDTRQLFQFFRYAWDNDAEAQIHRRQFYRSGPVWSPTGDAIAFIVRAMVGGSPDHPEVDVLYVVQSDGSGYRALFVTLNSHVHSIERSFAWSPDGTALTIVAHLTKDYEERLEYYSDGAPGYGEGADRALYETHQDPTLGRTGFTAYLVNADGSGVHQLLAGLPMYSGSRNTSTSSLEWSPDGSRLLLTDTKNVFVLGLESRKLWKVAEGSHASWSPDGSKIAVVAPDLNVLAISGGLR